MPVIKILKDGRELASIIVPEEFEIRIVHVSPPAPVQQPVMPPTHATGLTATVPPVPAEPPRVAVAEQAKPEKRADETKEVGEVMREAIVKAEETSRKLAEAVEKEKERKEDISLIRRVIEELIS